MISVGFKRVSKTSMSDLRQANLLWLSRDDGTSICMRLSAGSRGLSRNGGNIHVHPEIPLITIRQRIQRPMSQSISKYISLPDSLHALKLSPPLCLATRTDSTSHVVLPCSLRRSSVGWLTNLHSFNAGELGPSITMRAGHSHKTQAKVKRSTSNLAAVNLPP